MNESDIEACSKGVILLVSIMCSYFFYWFDYVSAVLQPSANGEAYHTTTLSLPRRGSKTAASAPRALMKRDHSSNGFEWHPFLLCVSPVRRARAFKACLSQACLSQAFVSSVFVSGVFVQTLECDRSL